MKIKKIEIFNIGILKNINEEIDKPLILFYGDIKQGKTTILEAIKLCFGGTFPKDIIRHGEQEAWVHVHFENGSIRREFYKNKKEETVSRPIQFVKDGGIVSSPVNEIKCFLNPFLLDQDHLKKMSEPDRNKFFVDLFGVDSSSEDEKIKELQEAAKTLRVEIKAYGDILLAKVEQVNIEEKRTELQKINDDYDTEVLRINGLNEEPIKHNNLVSQKKLRLHELLKEVNELEIWIKENPEQKITSSPVKPDTSVLQEEISNAKAQNVLFDNYTANLKKQEEKDEKKSQLTIKENEIKTLSSQKVAKLHEISKSIGILNLMFDENGSLIYENTTLGMLSTSQIMKLSSELSKLYPEGFGFELIDRGESLGTSIFDYVDKAKSENKTILATIVGEKPANIPENIGVYVVDQGELVS